MKSMEQQALLLIVRRDALRLLLVGS